MSETGQKCTATLLDAGAEVDARDSWGYTSTQRAATNNLGIATRALLENGAAHNAASGL